MDTVTRLKLAACDPLGQSLPRCADAAPMADLRAPQRHINANQIIADEYDAAWRRALAFGAPLVGLALLAGLLIVTAVRAGDKLEADLRWYHELEEMK